MLAETSFFYQVADKGQCKFFEELEYTNPQAARKYVLTITNSIGVWKKDIKLIETVRNYSKRKERDLKYEEQLLRQCEKIDASTEIPPMLKRRFPNLFGDVDFENLDFKEIVERIRSVESKLKSEEDYLKEYLNRVRREMPFLFE